MDDVEPNIVDRSSIFSSPARRSLSLNRNSPTPRRIACRLTIISGSSEVHVGGNIGKFLFGARIEILFIAKTNMYKPPVFYRIIW